MSNLKRIASIALALSLFAVAGCSSSKSAEEGSESMDKAKSEMSKEEEKTEKEGEMAKEGAEKTDEAAKEAEESGEKMKTAVKGGPEGVEVGGYCPVAYKMAGKPIEGKKELAVKQNGKTYYLANEKAQKAFKENPEKYSIKYDGWCATGLAKGKQIQGDPKFFLVHEGNTYLFSSEKAMKMFKEKPGEMAKKADANWKKMME